MQNASNNRTADTWRMPVYGGVFLLLMFAVEMPAWGQIVAFIDAINGQEGDFFINNFQKDIYLGRPLKEGDVIRIDRHGSSITLNLNGITKRVTHGSYTVEFISSPKQGGIVNQFIDWVSRLFVIDYRERMINIKGGNTQCESSKLFSIPILKNGNVKLLEGKRQLYVGWSGGPSPYRVQVYQVVNGTDTEVKKLEKRDIQIDTDNCQKFKIQEVGLKTWTFEAGERYKIKVTDGNGKNTAGIFTVVSDGHDPRHGAKVVMPVSTDSLDTEEIEVTSLPFHLQASWLAKHNNGEWKLEAYQTVAHHNSHSAQLVKWGLSLGQ